MVHRSGSGFKSGGKENGALVYYVDTSKRENYSGRLDRKLKTVFEGWLMKAEEGKKAFMCLTSR